MHRLLRLGVITRMLRNRCRYRDDRRRVYRVDGRVWLRNRRRLRKMLWGRLVCWRRGAWELLGLG